MRAMMRPRVIEGGCPLHLLQDIGVDFVRWVVAQVGAFIASVSDGALDGARHRHLPAISNHRHGIRARCHLNERKLWMFRIGARTVRQEGRAAEAHRASAV